ncbi:MAG: hydrolase TatD [Herpetosiphonaceae bacterium]|nr:MAG: hydrolase TatD [Herpetosiphonaceae bacterium]
MVIDSHAHLQSVDFDADRAEVLERSREAGVIAIINVGYDLPSSEAALELAQSYQHIYATAGIQPHYAAETTQQDLERLRTLLAQPKVVALGEIGLDYYHDRSPRPLQQELFRIQLRLAHELQLPVVIHSREAQEDTVRILREEAQGLRGVMHAFSGDWAYAEQCLDIGFFISLAGPVTFPKALELHEVARRVPLDRLLIETDCPYLSPHPFRGRRNEPTRVTLVARRIAELRGIAEEHVAQATTANTRALFDLSGLSV